MKRAAFACIVAALCLGGGYFATDCKPVLGPVGADVEAGMPVVNAVCSLVEGVDDNGTVRNVCATVDEVGQIIGFISTLRVADSGPPTNQCQVIPGTTFCATSAERAKSISFLVRARQARLLIDGGK